MISRVLSLALFAFAATPVLAKAATILPGYWESTSVTRFIVQSAPKVDRRCITAEKVDQVLGSPSTSHYTCNYSHRQVADGVADFKGQCHDKRGRLFNVDIHGTYAPEAFKLQARFQPNGLPISGAAMTDAHRISAECPSK